MLLTLLCLITHVFSRSITIQNYGFESDDYPLSPNSYHYEDPIISNWENYDPYSIIQPTSIGIANPTGGTSISDATFEGGTPEGIQCAYIHLNSSNHDQELGIFQIPGHIISMDTTYTLSVWIGNPSSSTWSDGTHFTNTAFNLYHIQLVATDTDAIIAEDNNTLHIPKSQWIQSIISVSITPGSPYIDQILTIRLLYQGSYGMIYFDDIVLEATPIGPTLSPTFSPTTEPLVLLMPSIQLSTTSLSTSTRKPSNVSKHNTFSLLDWIFIILGLLVFLSVVILMILIALFLRKKRHNEEKKGQVLRAQSVPSKRLESFKIEANVRTRYDVTIQMVGGNENHNIVHITSDSISYIPPQKRNGYSENEKVEESSESDDNVDEKADERLMDEIENTVQRGEDEEALMRLQDTPEQCDPDDEILAGLEDTPEEPDPDDDPKLLVGLEETLTGQ